jgi:hypothetical protein
LTQRRFTIAIASWRRVGERSGILRRRQWRIRSEIWADADHLEVAAELLAKAPFWSNEAVYLYDACPARGSKCIAAKYGARSKLGTTPSE